MMYYTCCDIGIPYRHQVAKCSQLFHNGLYDDLKVDNTFFLINAMGNGLQLVKYR